MTARFSPIRPAIPRDSRDDEPTVHTLRLAGTEIVVRRFGSGPPIVCLHAVGHDGRDFAALAQRLGHAFEFLSLDWPGQGTSPAEAAPPTARRYGEILTALLDSTPLLDATDLTDVVLLGNSIGGAAAIIATANRPDRVRGLVLCNTGGLVRPGLLVRFVCRRQAKFYARGEAGDPAFAGAFRRHYERVLTGEAALQRREEIVRAAYEIAPLLRRAWLGFAAPDADLRSLAPQIRCPVLFAWARHDRLIPWRFVRAAARRFPDHQVALLGGGHAAFLESPDEFDPVLVRFLESVNERGNRALDG